MKVYQTRLSFMKILSVI